MALFGTTSGKNCGGGGGTGGEASLKSWAYEYSLRFRVRNDTYLRVGEGMGNFSNTSPDIVPINSTLTEISISNIDGGNDAFTAEIIRNGLVAYVANKPAGNDKFVFSGSLATFSTNDEVSVRVTGFSVPVDSPRVRLYFEEVI